MYYNQTQFHYRQSNWILYGWNCHCSGYKRKIHLRKEDVSDSEEIWKYSVMCKKMNDEDKQTH